MTQQKGFAVYLNVITNKIEKYTKMFMDMPTVKLAYHCDDWQQKHLTRFLVRTYKPQRLNHFKCIPYIAKVEPFNAKWIVLHEDLESSSEELPIEESIEEFREQAKAAYNRDPRLTEMSMLERYIYERRLEDARLRRELEDIKIEEMIGFSTNTPDERQPIPERRYWPSKQEISLKRPREDDDLDHVVKKIRKIEGPNSKLEDQYFGDQLAFYRNNPSYDIYSNQ